MSVVDVPEEVCDLNPIETCRYATKLVTPVFLCNIKVALPHNVVLPPNSPQVPHLSPTHECTLVPKEVFNYFNSESATETKFLCQHDSLKEVHRAE